ncbi:cytochrome P450 [Cynara cardunculus var. scolymus]|uniref:Cytochrome P450 n=1 Tax=Cynara cardunculus var. scolymus TaxID=59895 RepID=A0A118JX00_CYNCS|nr:cytochrome P450 [Cynara cardunculus var. scolymus]
MISNSMWSWWSELTGNKEELTLALLAISIITVVVSWYRSRKHTFPLPPGPRGLPVVGYLPFLDVNLHHEFTKMAQRYGPIFKLKLGSKTHIVVSSSDLAKVVVREQDDIFANRDPPVTGIAITYGGQRITFLSSLNVVTSMMWGKSLVDEEKSKDLGVELREVISKIVELLGTANVSDLFPVVARLDLQGLLREMKRQKKVLEGIFDRIMNERIATKVEEGGEQAGRKDFLQILLELKGENTASSFTFDQIKGLFTEIITGGTDTTSTMAEWIMAELLQNPKILKMVQDELEEVVGLSNIVEESHISKLYYLDAVIKETFRLHPPLPLLITRCPNQSCSVGGYTVPKGANVYLNVWAIHRNPEYWDNPLEFNPKRFINPDGTSKYDYNGYNFNYIPFGSGRRKCPGVRLGEKMLVYLLASLLHSFNWTLPTDKEHDLSDKFGIVLKKRKPLIAIPSQRLSDKNLYE